MIQPSTVTSKRRTTGGRRRRTATRERRDGPLPAHPSHAADVAPRGPPARCPTSGQARRRRGCAVVAAPLDAHGHRSVASRRPAARHAIVESTAAGRSPAVAGHRRACRPRPTSQTCAAPRPPPHAEQRRATQRRRVPVRDRRGRCAGGPHETARDRGARHGTAASSGRRRSRARRRARRARAMAASRSGATTRSLASSGS